MENENMNQQVKPKRTKTIVIIGCVLIVIGLGIGLFIYRFKETTEKVDPVVENARRNSMKSTAQQVLYSLRTVLTDNFELYPGTYEWDENLFDVGGINSPFGGKYIYSKGEGTKIGSSFYRIDETKDITKDCGPNKTSFVTIERNDDDKYIYSICLSTTKNAWLAGTNDQVDGLDDSIFYGDAAKK